MSEKWVTRTLCTHKKYRILIEVAPEGQMLIRWRGWDCFADKTYFVLQEQKWFFGKFWCNLGTTNNFSRGVRRWVEDVFGLDWEETKAKLLKCSSTKNRTQNNTGQANASTQ
jgi:hypothetical protein